MVAVAALNIRNLDEIRQKRSVLDHRRIDCTRLGRQPAEVLNGGIGSYNAERYVSRFLKQLTGLNATDIVVQYFMRDPRRARTTR